MELDAGDPILDAVGAAAVGGNDREVVAVLPTVSTLRSYSAVNSLMPGCRVRPNILDVASGVPTSSRTSNRRPMFSASSLAFST